MLKNFIFFYLNFRGSRLFLKKSYTHLDKDIKYYNYLKIKYINLVYFSVYYLTYLLFDLIFSTYLNVPDFKLESYEWGLRILTLTGYSFS